MSSNNIEQDNLIGQAASFLEAIEKASRLAVIDKPILVVGERGTGKELIASRIHYLSKRWENNFIKLNCAALTESLLETELFGHEAGAFTGASKKHIGKFEQAHHGTLFLDELATTSGRVQEKLLRVIEYGQFERVGGSKTISVDVRLVAATNNDLPSLASQGKFRADLLDRLAFDVVTLPPLRERKEDIPILAEYFSLKITKELKREFFAGFTKQSLQELINYAWLGNVRELRNVVERNVYHSDPDYPIADIVFDPFESPYRPQEQHNNYQQKETAIHDANPSFPIDLKQVSQEYEIQLIQQALESSQFSQKKAAELLSLTYHQFRGYLKKYDLLG